MTGRMDFGFTFGSPGTGLSAQARREDPFRIVVLGDFSGHGLRGEAHPKPLAQRMPQRVDIDNIDAVMRRMAPTVALPLGDGAPVALTFGALDDFHPDQLLGQLPPPSVMVTVSAPADIAPQPAAAAARENDASTLERLLGRKPEPAPTTGLDALIQRIVAPSLVPEAAPGAAQSQAARHEAMGMQMRAVLHHPAVQSLEAAWRGVHGLVRTLELTEELQLHLLDVSQAELLADLAAAQGDVASTQLARSLMKQADADEQAPSWPLVVGLYALGPSAADLGLLTALGTLAARMAGTFLASALPSVVGLDSFGAAVDPADWPGMAADEQARWAAFRSSPAAASVHLATPRILLRLPYGKATDAVDVFPFEEMAPGFAHESCLWGHGALACAQLIGQTFMEQGWAMRLGERLDVEDLPAYIVERDGDKHLLACAEANLSESAGERLLALGLMPLLSYKHRNAVRVMSLRAMA
jgi:type VI secretion system protein ImpC